MSNTNPLQHLLSLLEEVKKDRNIKSYAGDMGQHNYLDPGHPLVKEIVSLGSWALFTDKGHCDFEAQMELKRAGFKVFPAKVLDGVGWLYACISIPGVGVVVCYNDVLLDEYGQEEEEDEYEF